MAWAGRWGGECGELVSEIIAVTGRKRFFKKLVDDGQKVGQAAYGSQRRAVGSAEVTTGGGQPQSVFNDGQSDTLVVKLGGELSVRGSGSA